MDKLKDYIKKNRSQFDDMEPTDGHAERFATRLNGQKKSLKRSVRILITTISGIAAAILIMLMIFPLGKIEDSRCARCALSAELAEVSSYYAIQLEEEIAKIQQLVNYTDEETRNELLSDIIVMREESNAFLQQLCASHMDDSDSIPIIIKHYQSQIDALHATVSILENNMVSV